MSLKRSGNAVVRMIGDARQSDHHSRAPDQPLPLRQQHFRQALAHGAKTNQSDLDFLHTCHHPKKLKKRRIWAVFYPLSCALSKSMLSRLATLRKITRPVPLCPGWQKDEEPENNPRIIDLSRRYHFP